jgi:hypothetical protein
MDRRRGQTILRRGELIFFRKGSARRLERCYHEACFVPKFPADTMSLGQYWHDRNQFRLVLFGHKAIEVGVVCLLVMVKGHLADVTLTHLAIATKTGLFAVCPALGVTYTRYARYFANRWSSSAFVGICTFFADVMVHESHFSWRYGDAALTAGGAFVLSLLISYTPIGKQIDRLAESFLHRQLAPTNS